MNSHYRAVDRPTAHSHRRLAAALLAPMAAATVMVLNQLAQWIVAAFKAWVLGSSSEPLMLAVAISCALWLLSLRVLVKRERTRGDYR